MCFAVHCTYYLPYLLSTVHPCHRPSPSPAVFRRPPHRTAPPYASSVVFHLPRNFLHRSRHPMPQSPPHPRRRALPVVFVDRLGRRFVLLDRLSLRRRHGRPRRQGIDRHGAWRHGRTALAIATVVVVVTAIRITVASIAIAIEASFRSGYLDDAGIRRISLRLPPALCCHRPSKHTPHGREVRVVQRPGCLVSPRCRLRHRPPLARSVVLSIV